MEEKRKLLLLNYSAAEMREEIVATVSSDFLIAFILICTLLQTSEAHTNDAKGRTCEARVDVGIQYCTRQRWQAASAVMRERWSGCRWPRAR